MLDVYIQQNIFSITVQTGIWLPAFIMAIVTGFNAIKAEGRVRFISSSFSAFCWAIGLTYFFWTIRNVFFTSSSQPSDGWLLLWQLAYGFVVLAFFFLALWSLTLISPQLLEDKKWLYIILVIPWLIVIVDLFIIAPTNAPNVVQFANVNDLKPDIILEVFATLAVLVYTFIPLIGFLRYLWASENRGTTNFRRILIIEIGLLFFAIGAIVDASKLAPNEALIVTRGFEALGIILMFIGLKLPKRFQIASK